MPSTGTTTGTGMVKGVARKRCGSRTAGAMGLSNTQDALTSMVNQGGTSRMTMHIRWKGRVPPLLCISQRDNYFWYLPSPFLYFAWPRVFFYAYSKHCYPTPSWCTSWWVIFVFYVYNPPSRKFQEMFLFMYVIIPCPLPWTWGMRWCAAYRPAPVYLLFGASLRLNRLQHCALCSKVLWPPYPFRSASSV